MKILYDRPPVRKLLINLDDLGMHPTINEAITEILALGTIRSTSLLAPGVFFEDALMRLKKVGSSRVGVHLTLTSEYPKILMKPLTDGVSFTPECPTVKEGLDLKKVREELWAQVEKVQKTGLEISHLDGHMFFYEEFSYGNRDLLNLVQRMAHELAVPIRNVSDSVRQTFFIWEEFEDVLSRHLYYKLLFEEIPFEKGELILHPALNTKELHEFSGSGVRRVADHLYFSKNDYLHLAQKHQVTLESY